MRFKARSSLSKIKLLPILFSFSIPIGILAWQLFEELVKDQKAIAHERVGIGELRRLLEKEVGENVLGDAAYQQFDEIVQKYELNLDSRADTFAWADIVINYLPIIYDQGTFDRSYKLTRFRQALSQISLVCGPICKDYDTRRDQFLEELKKAGVQDYSRQDAKSLMLKSLDFFDERLGYYHREISNRIVYVTFFSVILSIVGMVYLLFTSFHVLRSRIKFDQMDLSLDETQEMANVGSWIFDSELKELHCSNQMLKIFDLDEKPDSKMLYGKFFSKIHPNDLNRVNDLLEKAVLTGQRFSFDCRALVGGNVKYLRWVIKSSQSLADSETSSVLVGTIQDITEMVRTQEENKFILDSMEMGIWRYNPKTQELIWDKSMFDLYEIQESDFAGHYNAWESTLTPESKAEAVNDLQMALSGTKQFQTSFEIVTKQGQKKHIGAKGTVVRDEQGQPIMMYGINWDKTKEISFQMELKSSRELLDSILSNIPCMIFVKDYSNDLRFTYLNRTGEKLLGVKSETLIGKCDHDLFPRDQADFFVENDKDVFKSGQVKVILREQISTPHGTKWLRTHKVPIIKDGNPHLLVGISMDITDEVETQKQLELERLKSIHTSKLASLGEMSAGMAHEINNPLAVISGALTLLQLHRLDEEKFNQKIGIANRAAHRIEKIVKGLRKFSRSSEGIVRKPVAVGDIISEVLVIVESKSKRHDTLVEIENETKGLIKCDDVEVEQVLVNLVNNGIDAAKGQADKWVKIRAFEEGDEIVIQVLDSGLGVNREIEDKLFQPFFTTKTVGEGTGLGLSISKGILDQHNATIVLKRDQGHTCFEIRFPKESDDNVSPAA